MLNLGQAIILSQPRLFSHFCYLIYSHRYMFVHGSVQVFPVTVVLQLVKVMMSLL